MAGIAQYSEFFSNPLFTQVINEVPIPKKYISNRFLPREETFETKFHESVITRQVDMANIVNGLAEAPLTDRDPMRHISGEIADISQAYVVTKEEMGALMYKGEQDARRKLIAKQLLNKSATIKSNVDARIEWMAWQALGEGTLTYAKNGIYFQTDFGILAANKKTAAIRWDGVTPTIIADYESWVQYYVDLNGVTPDTFVTSISVIRTVLNDATVRKQVTGLTDKLVTLDELNSFLGGRQMPKMEAFDSTVTYRDPNTGGTRTTARLLNIKKGVFLREGGELGNQLMGPTVENQMNPGIFGRTLELELPMRNLIEIVTASFPKLSSPDLVLQVLVMT